MFTFQNILHPFNRKKIYIYFSYPFTEMSTNLFKNFIDAFPKPMKKFKCYNLLENRENIARTQLGELGHN